MGVEDKPGTRVKHAVRHGGSLQQRHDSVITKEQHYRERLVGTKTGRQGARRGSDWVSPASRPERLANRSRIVLIWDIVLARPASKVAIRVST